MLYEEALISGILEERRAADGSREFLVSFQDGREDAWVHERDVAAGGVHRTVLGLHAMLEYGYSRPPHAICPTHA
jgi:hypothetical protein